MQRGDRTAGITARRAAEENTSLSVTLSIKIDSNLDNKTTLSDPDQVASEQFSSPSLDLRVRSGLQTRSDVAMQFLTLIAVTLYEIFLNE